MPVWRPSTSFHELSSRYIRDKIGDATGMFEGVLTEVHHAIEDNLQIAVDQNTKFDQWSANS